MRIKDTEISRSSPGPYIIAEIGSGHEGSVKRAKQITRAAAETGADAIKYQIWQKEQFLTPTCRYYRDFEAVEIRLEQWVEILDYAHSLNLAIETI